MKVLIIANARHGKDTLAELLNKTHGMSFKSSSEEANELFMFDLLKDKYGYNTLEECFLDRVNHRKEWYDEICAFNKENKTRLAESILSKVDCYVGMRDHDEFNGAVEKNLFDVIIWVDASERLPEESKESFNIPNDYSDYIIENNGTLEEFEEAALELGNTLYTRSYSFE